jgi:hypothetical protein
VKKEKIYDKERWVLVLLAEDSGNEENEFLMFYCC